MTRDDVPLGKGQCDIRLQVDNEVEVHMRGDQVTVRTISGQEARDDGSECNAPLPNRDVGGFSFEVKDSRNEIRMLAEPSLTKDAAKNMRLFISGSAPLLIETFNEWKERTGQTILERYGMSETIMLTSNPYDEKQGERRGGTVGFPLPGVGLRVVGDDGQELPTGHRGLLSLVVQVRHLVEVGVESHVPAPHLVAGVRLGGPDALVGHIDAHVGGRGQGEGDPVLVALRQDAVGLGGAERDGLRGG